MPVNLWLPRAFEISGYILPTYQLFLVAGFLAFYAVFFLEIRRVGISLGDALILGAIILLAAIDSAWIASIMMKGERGQSLYAAAAGAVLCGGVYAWWRGISIFRVGDAAAPAAALAFGIMKLGCLVGGCCYGRPSEGLLTAVYSADGWDPIPKVLEEHPAWEGVALEPVQLWVAILALGVFIISYAILPWSRRLPGRRLGAALFAYAAGRFAIDFASGVPACVSVGPFSGNQLAGLAMAIAGIVLMFGRRGRCTGT